LKNNKIKIFILTIIMCILILFIYARIRDFYIVKNNNNYELESFIINQDGEEIKNRD